MGKFLLTLTSTILLLRPAWFQITSILLFIDYRKAFDTVDSNLLLLKLFHYGFDNAALELLADFFANRPQSTKVNGKLSASMPAGASMPLGVPQGFCLGPLFLLIFINDLAYLLEDVSSKLFADDTIISSPGPDVQKRIKLLVFLKQLEQKSPLCSSKTRDSPCPSLFF